MRAEHGGWTQGWTKVQGLLIAPQVSGAVLDAEKRAWDQTEPLCSGSLRCGGKGSPGNQSIHSIHCGEEACNVQTVCFVQAPEEGPAEEEALKGRVGAGGAVVFPEHRNVPLHMSFLSSVPAPLSYPGQ